MKFSKDIVLRSPLSDGSVEIIGLAANLDSVDKIFWSIALLEKVLSEKRTFDT